MELILSQNYEGVLDQFRDAFKALDSSALMSYWSIGALVAEFEDGVKRHTYKDATIAKLAADLQERGVLGKIKNATRWLYWARKLHATYSVERLTDLLDKGLTLTHLKHLSSLSDEDVARVEKRLFRNGKPISAEEALGLVQETVESMDAQEAKVVHAEVIAGTPPLEPYPSEYKKPADSAGGGTDGSSPDLPDNAPLKTPAKEKAPEGASTKSLASESTVSPYKALKVIDSAAEKLDANIAEAFVAIKETRQRGFDVQKVQDKWEAKVADTRALLRKLQNTLPGLIDAMNNE